MTPTTEEQRREFEAWAKTHFGCHEHSLSRDWNSGYYNTVHTDTFGGRHQPEYAPVSMLWAVWQAATEAASHRSPPPAAEGVEEAAMLDWIEENATCTGGGNGFELRVFVPHDSECLREAIRAAITKAGKREGNG